MNKTALIFLPSVAAVLLSCAFTGPSDIPADPDIQKYSLASDREPILSKDRMIELLHRRVKYIFVIYQENRSFDSYFGTFPGAEGLFTKPAEKTPGFNQPIVDTDGSVSIIKPFRIGPKDYAADIDDVDHSHSLIAEKMDVAGGSPKMDRFAETEEAKYSKGGKPSLMAKQMGELTMAYMDGDTVPFLWRYANRFVLFDRIFQLMTGPSTPGNLAIIAAQSGQTQAALHTNQAYKGNGNSGSGVPVLNDNDPYWGSPADRTVSNKQPVNPHDYPGYGVQSNQTYATIMLSLAGKEAAAETSSDLDAKDGLEDLDDDIAFLSKNGKSLIPWAWYEEGYSREPADMNEGPSDASGLHAPYVTHHNGPQYLGLYRQQSRDEQ